MDYNLSSNIEILNLFQLDKMAVNNISLNFKLRSWKIKHIMYPTK